MLGSYIIYYCYDNVCVHVVVYKADEAKFVAYYSVAVSPCTFSLVVGTLQASYRLSASFDL